MLISLIELPFRLPLDCQIDAEEGLQMSRCEWKLLAQNLLGEIASV